MARSKKPKQRQRRIETPKRAMSIEPLYTAIEIAENLRVAPNTIKKWAREGRIPYTPISDRGDMRFDLNEVRIAIEQHAKRSA